MAHIVAPAQDHEQRPKFSALEKTHVAGLGKLALAIG